MRSLSRTGLAAAALVSGSLPAFAHAPIKGIGTFYNGVLHPVLVPGHLLLLLATGFFLGQFAPRSSRTALPVFALALAAGLAVSAFEAPALPSWMVSGLALLAGLLVALRFEPFSALAIWLALVAGLLVGLDSVPDAGEGDRAWLALSGTAVGGLLLVIFAGGASATFNRSWQPIAIRVLGSWVAASSLMMLTFELTARNGAA